MKMVPNALGRLIPEEIDGKKLKPFMGAHAGHGGGRKAAPPIRAAADYANKLRPSRLLGHRSSIRDGITRWT